MYGRLAKELREGPKAGRLHAEIMFTRFGPGTFDDDNLIAAFKAYRDGVADGFGIRDDHPRIEFWYWQEKSKMYEIRIEIRLRRLT